MVKMIYFYLALICPPLRMPNWIYNRVTVEGARAEVAALHDAKFDFTKLYPCPDEDNWYNWCCAHWGTKWPADEVEIVEYEEGEQTSVLEATFNTAWSPPHGFLAHLTQLFPSMKIHCAFEEEAEQTFGQSRYAEGKMDIEQFHPHEYKPSALEEFAKKNPWFDWESLKETLLGYEVNLDSMEEENQAPVDILTLNMTFEEYVENSEKQFAAIDAAIKKGDVQVQRG